MATIFALCIVFAIGKWLCGLCDLANDVSKLRETRRTYLFLYDEWVLWKQLAPKMYVECQRRGVYDETPITSPKWQSEQNRRHQLRQTVEREMFGCLLSEYVERSTEQAWRKKGKPLPQVGGVFLDDYFPVSWYKKCKWSPNDRVPRPDPSDWRTYFHELKPYDCLIVSRDQVASLESPRKEAAAKYYQMVDILKDKKRRQLLSQLQQLCRIQEQFERDYQEELQREQVLT